MDLKFGVVDKAILSLKRALASPPQNDLERDGVIQRFEYTFELLWKTGKRFLNQSGLPSASPRAVIRDLAAQGFLSDPARWMVFLLARNYTSHTYDEATATWVFSECSQFLAEAEILLAKLKAEVLK